MLRNIRFFIVGILVDSALLASLLAYLWARLFHPGRGPSTFDEYVSGGVFVLWVGVQSIAGAWPVSIPLLVAPPAVGLWRDLKSIQGAGRAAGGAA